MSSSEDLREQLYDKMSDEQDLFIEKLKRSTPEEVIASAYEKIMKDDILMTFEDSCFLDDNQIKELLKLDYPLSACYNEWLGNDYSYMDMLRDTADDFSNKLVEENKMKAKKNIKKNDEPER